MSNITINADLENAADLVALLHILENDSGVMMTKFSFILSCYEWWNDLIIDNISDIDAPMFLKEVERVAKNIRHNIAVSKAGVDV